MKIDFLPATRSSRRKARKRADSMRDTCGGYHSLRRSHDHSDSPHGMHDSRRKCHGATVCTIRTNNAPQAPCKAKNATALYFCNRQHKSPPRGKIRAHNGTPYTTVFNRFLEIPEIYQRKPCFLLFLDFHTGFSSKIVLVSV